MFENSLISIVWTLLDLQPYISFNYVWIITYCLQKYNLQKVTFNHYGKVKIINANVQNAPRHMVKLLDKLPVPQCILLSADFHRCEIILPEDA